MHVFTFIVAIKGIFLSRQTYFLGDFNILGQIMPAGVSLHPIKYSII